jgi:dTDP-glucose 4,6-dehydratase
MKKYCILGCGGSFGLHSAFYFLENVKLKKVIGVGRNFLREEPFSLNITKHEKFEYHSRHIYHEQDLLLELLDKEKPEVIINFAAQGEGAVSWKHSWRFFETNSVALSKLCEELSKRKWLERFIHIGTSEMYGSVDKPSKEDEPIKPSSPYASSKVAFDLYLLSISKFTNFPMNIIRPSNAYCPAQLLHRIIPKTIVSGLIGKKVPLHGGGRAEKSYIHARDLARAIYLVSEKAPLGKIYNAGPTEPTSIKKVVELCANALGKNFDDICEMAPDRIGQDSKYWLNSDEIFKDIGWKQEIFWEPGLKEMVEWGKKYLNELRNYPMDYVLRS